MRFQQFHERYIVRLETGESVIEKLLDFLRSERIEFANLSAAGAVQNVRLAYWNAITSSYEYRDFEVGGTHEFLVIHHTGCGMLSLTSEQLRERLRRNLGVDASGIDFLPFGDLEQSVREDVEKIRSSPFLPKDISVSGFIYGRAHRPAAPGGPSGACGERCPLTKTGSPGTR